MPLSGEISFLIKHAFLEEKRTSEGVKFFENLLTKKENRARETGIYVSLLIANGDYEQAEGELNKMSFTQKKKDTYNYLQANLFHKKGSHAEAMDSIKIAIVNPTSILRKKLIKQGFFLI